MNWCGSHRQQSINFIHRLCGSDERASPMPSLDEDRRRAAGRNARSPSPGDKLMFLSCLELGSEIARVPQVLQIAQAALGLDPVMDAVVPLAAGHVSGPRDPVGVLEDEAVSAGVHLGRTVREPHPVHVAPGAQRVQLEGDRARSADDTVDDRN